jgi:hypothetical protein
MAARPQRKKVWSDLSPVNLYLARTTVGSQRFVGGKNVTAPVTTASAPTPYPASAAAEFATTGFVTKRGKPFHSKSIRRMIVGERPVAPEMT